MSKEISLVIAIVVLVALLGIFLITFIAYRKAPLPKGCENLKADDEKCAACSNSECAFHKKEEDK